MEVVQLANEADGKKHVGELRRTRFACAHCGSTWIEMVGLVILHGKKSDDVCFHVGMESESCQTCRFRPLECPECGSKDIYEIKFAEQISETVPLSFSQIRKV